MNTWLNLAVVLLLACAKGNEMKNMDSGAPSLPARRPSLKRPLLSKCGKNLANERISVQLRGKPHSGPAVDLSTAKDTTTIESIEVTFVKNGERKTFVWGPIELENPYFLFRKE